MALPDYPIWTGIRGTVNICPVDPPLPCGRYVYQRVRAGLGNVTSDPSRSLQIRRHVVPFDPMTPAQLAHRAKFRAAADKWATLTPEQRAEWAVIAQPRRLFAWQAYLSWYLRNA